MFYKSGKDVKRFVDGVFAISSMAKQDSSPDTINATVGCLCGEDGKLVAFKSVFDCVNNVSDRDKASYAKSPAGNPDFREAIAKYILEDKAKGQAVATSGGTGSITLALELCRNSGQKVLIPSVSWGNYKQILNERDLEAVLYDIYDLNDLLSKIESEDKPFVIINSPCENPTGHSYTLEQWKKILDALSSKEESILFNDIAYMDFAYDEGYKDYLKLFNDLDKNVLVFIGASCSKSFSFYGERLGALIIINKDEEFVDLFVNQCELHIRTSYASCNNAAQIAITDLLNNHLDEYNKEKLEYRSLLKQRSDLFIKEAKEVNLSLYDYKEGFFVTVKYDDNDLRDRVHKALLDNHIYTVKINHGIRVGVCAASVAKTKGLAKRIKEIEDTCR